jgi:glycerol-3-phosphate O-acyltransferase
MSKEKPFYSFALEHKPGFLLGYLLYRLFKQVRYEESMTEDLRLMNREGTVVYAIKYRGALDYLLSHYRFRMARLPYPRIGFDLNMSLVLPLGQVLRIVRTQLSHLVTKGELPNPYGDGFLRESLSKGTTALLCLVDPKGFTRQFIHSGQDRIAFLLETQREVDRPIFIVPQLVVYHKAPEKEFSGFRDIFFGYHENPGAIRKIALFFRHHRGAFVDFGRPLDLKAYLKTQSRGRSLSEMAAEIRQILIDGIDVQKRVILGPIMKSRQQVKETVLTDATVQRAIETTASKEKKKLKAIKRRAQEYFNEIAADYNGAYVEFFNITLSWLWKRVFDGIDVHAPELTRVREAARKGALIYVPSHKSHIDYLVLNYILYQHQMHVPRIAAGKNLAFWPMGHVFRKSGAFFIRRTFRGMRLYSTVFSRYIKALIEEGHPLEFFIEGGRSRSGKLILPKIGFLSILIKAFQEGYAKDLIFVPASISYDRILEEKSYLKEVGGGEKEKENFVQILKARHFLNKRFGKIYIRMGTPLSLSEYLSQCNAKGSEVHRHLALTLIRSINRVTLVTPLAVVATAILAGHRRGFHLQEIEDTAGLLLSFLRHRGAPLATSFDDFERTIEETLTLLINWKVVSFLEDVEGEERFYYVDEEKKGELEYYKNTIIHYFILPAFVAVSLLSGSEEVRPAEKILEDYAFLKGLFRYEFVYEETGDPVKDLDAAVRYFLDAAMIVRQGLDGGFALTRLGFEALPIWAALAKTFMESYWIVLRVMLRQESKVKKAGDPFKTMAHLGLRYQKMGLVDHVEAISRLNFQNAVRALGDHVHEAQKASGGDPAAASDILSELGQRLYDLAHFTR